MRTIDPNASALLLVDFQERLMPAIHEGAATVAAARLLLDAARLLDIPVGFTEQNPSRLGATLPALAPMADEPVLHKMQFSACGTAGLTALPDRPALVVTGCEAHVCVLQTVLGLRDAGRAVYVVEDATGSRTAASKGAAMRRMAAHGAEIVTAEMVVFEWLGSAGHPRFRAALKLLK